MEGKLTSKGTLQIKRGKTLRDVYCPEYIQDKCTELCSLFGEPEEIIIERTLDEGIPDTKTEKNVLEEILAIVKGEKQEKKKVVVTSKEVHLSLCKKTLKFTKFTDSRK